MPLEETRLADRGPIVDVLLDNVAANTDGVWKPTQRRRPIHITVEGVGAGFVATVTIHGSLQKARPADSDNSRVVLMSTTSASLSFSVDVPYEWIKVQVTGYGSGTLFSGLAGG